MDVGMGLVSILIIAMAAGWRTEDADHPRQRLSARSLLVPGLVALASALLIVTSMLHTPKNIMPGGSIVFTAAMAISGAAICWWMLKGKIAEGVSLLVVVHLLTTLAFNPVSKAPRDVELANGNLPYLTDVERPGKKMRTLVVNGDGIGALTLAAAGVPIANGVFYYPHEDFWRRMGLPEKKWSTVNRYQHLGFYVDAEVQESYGYYVISPTIDQVHIHVHPWNFDFSRTGADRVAVLTGHAAELRRNQSLNWLGEFRGLHWFAVKNPGKP